MTGWVFVVLSVLAELFEAAWQQADTLGGALENGRRYYRRSVFLFLAMHPGYWLVLFISLYYDLLTWPIIAMLAFKTLDIFFKFDMIGRMEGRGERTPAMEAMLTAPIPRWYFLAGAAAYPWFVYVALCGNGC